MSCGLQAQYNRHEKKILAMDKITALWLVKVKTVKNNLNLNER